MDDQLINIARFTSVNEAAVARNALEAAGITAFLDGDTTATWLSYVGTALGGVKVLVRSGDADQARAVLWHHDADDASEVSPGDACSADDGFSKPEDEDEVPSSSLPITRAWRAAIIGILFLPPLLNLYSMWILIRHRLLLGGRTRATDWRAVTALAVNMSVFAVVGLFVYAAVRPPGPDVPAVVPGHAIEVEYAVPLIPAEPASEKQHLPHTRAGDDQPQPPPAANSPGR